jgi:hypothetical protein
MCSAPKAPTISNTAPPPPTAAPQAMALPDGSLGAGLSQLRLGNRSGLAELQAPSALTLPKQPAG